MGEKVLFVGQAPGKNDGPPVSGRIGRRLASLLGLGLDEFTVKFDRTNVLNRYPGKQGKGDAFPMSEAREAASLMDLSGHPFVVLLGKNTARAFGVRDPEYFMPVEAHGTMLVPFPHPSGINRWWNDPANIELASRHLKQICASSI